MSPRGESTRRRSSRRRATREGSAFVVRPRALLGALLVVAAAVALPLPTAAATVAPAPIADTILAPSDVRLFAASVSYWGGTYTASTGEQVMIRVSDDYSQDPALPQRWAEFLAGLVHGSELSTVTAFLAPLSEVQTFCGRSALACYSPQAGLLVAPAEDPAADVSAEAVVMHEYGHHVAASRSDAPWLAVDWGPKRWASYVQVCARTRSGQLFPGAEDGSNYRLNPGEGWAETYRLLNERRRGAAESPWDVVSTALYPDATALSLAERDVTDPWQRNTVSSLSAALTRTRKTRTVTVATPLDGTLRVTARGARNARMALDLYAGADRVAHAVVSGATTKAVSTTVCGARSYRVSVTLQRAVGTIRLAISKP
jgi:hypothetical protein